MKTPLLALPLLVACLLWAAPAHAFWETESEDGDQSLVLRGFARFTNTYTRNPDAPLLYPEKADAQTQAVARLLGDAWLGRHLKLELNAYQVLLSSTASSPFAAPEQIGEAGRSDALDWRWSGQDHAQAHLAVDRLALRIEGERLRLTLGRQPIGLAATFYFTPNDFFSPFSAQTFFRAYKAGVDAARLEWSLSDFTQLQLIASMGYEPRADALDKPSLTRSSAVARGSTVLADTFEVALLGGRLPRGYVAGGDLQGELTETIGVRMEGHVLFPEDDPGDPSPELALVLDRRFESTLHLRLEGFYHGGGATDPQRYLQVALDPDRALSYLGRYYVALGAGYELTPLLNLDSVILANLGDPSGLASLYLLYSLSDEAEVALVGSLPWGRVSQGLEIKSEFGLYPASLTMDFRLTF